ncbi:MAG: heparan-alpha-glucosaminide N-acetyltransferase domain-containing protein [Anaerolineae bacterium]
MENRTRVLSLDLARGMGALGMVAVHVLIRYGSYAANQSAYGVVVLFLGGPPAAPVFLFLIGTSLAFSKHATLRDNLWRGAKLLVLGYVLNFLRGTLPAFLGLKLGILQREALRPYTPENLFWIVDVLHCAGLSLMVIGVVRRLLPRPWTWLLLSAAVALGSPVMWGRMSGWPLLDGCLALLWGTSVTAQFPALPWISYPLTGMAFGVWLAASADRDALFRRAAGVGALLLLAGGLLILDRPTFHIGDYFHSGPGAVIAFTGFALVWLAVCQWLVKHIRVNAFFRLCYDWSARITLFFVVHWIIIGWGIGLAGHTQHGIPMLVFLTVAVLVLTDTLVRQVVAEGRHSGLAQPGVSLTAEIVENVRK